jgi:hypothetical protein
VVTKQVEKVETLEEIQVKIIQDQKDSILPSLLYVTRKLGELEGTISMQPNPDENLVNVQMDFQRLYDNMVERAGIEQLPETDNLGIGKEGC